MSRTGPIGRARGRGSSSAARRARFIRMPGGVYRRGDTEAERRLDFMGKPLTPHWVRVGGFYIQETEVTNGEVEDYLASHPEDAESLVSWKDIYEKQKRKINPETEARSFPASCIRHDWAGKYAVEMGGRLPTEAQWEYAARSGGKDDKIFPWGRCPALRPAARTEGQHHAPLRRLGGQGQGDFLAVAKVKFIRSRSDRAARLRHGGQRQRALPRRLRALLELDLSANFQGSAPGRPGRPEQAAVPPRARTLCRAGGSISSSEKKARTFYRAGREGRRAPGEVGFRIVIECPPERKPSDSE